MFLHLLSPEERPAFLSLAHQLVLSDGLHIAADETEILARMAAEMGVAPEAGQAVVPGEAAAAFQAQRSRDAALLELIAVAYADDTFSPQENAFIQALATSFGITPQRITEMDTWVRDIKALTIRGASLLTV